MIMATEMGARLVIREATDADASAIVGVVRAANAEYEQALSPGAYDAYVANIVALVGRRNECSRLLVADADGEVVGAVTFLPEASLEGLGLPAQWAGFRALAVHPRARGAGIGRALVERCVETARARGAATLAIHAGSFMSSAAPFYESLGFRRCPEYDTGSKPVLGPAAEEIFAIAYRLDL
jgi:predicted N-acetyltransferase YhbS